MKNRNLLIGFLLFHGLVVLVGANLYHFSKVPSWLDQAITFYSSWTGGGHSYTFFSPDVGHQNVAKAFLLMEDDQIVEDAYGSGGSSFEMRLSSLLHSLYNAQTHELSARILAAHALNKHPGARLVVISIGKYVPPDIAGHRAGRAADYQEFYRGTFFAQAE